MRIYTSKSGIIGPCGPCSFINLTGIKGSIKLEKELAELGRLKPFHASTYSAFLVWAEQFDKKLTVYTSSKKLNNKMFKLMYFYEETPKKVQKKFKEQATKLFENRNKKFSFRIRKLTDPIKKLNQLLEEGNLVAVLTSDFYLNKKRKPVSHWIVAFKKTGERYHFKDSTRGLTVLSKKELLKGFKLNKKDGFYPTLVSYKKHENK